MQNRPYTFLARSLPCRRGISFLRRFSNKDSSPTWASERFEAGGAKANDLTRLSVGQLFSACQFPNISRQESGSNGEQKQSFARDIQSILFILSKGIF